MKTIFIPGHGVPIILIIRSNMPCINVLTCTHNLSMDRKFGVHPHVRLKSFVAFDMECRMTFIQHEDNLSFHILHQWKPKDLKKSDHNSLC